MEPLNTFGVYDNTNDKMYTHYYKNKTSDQFIDFIRRVDSRYDSSVKKIFVVLDNASIHRSKRTRNAIIPYHSSIVLFVFQPTRSPHLNLIGVRWFRMQRQAINNSTFKNELDIGKALSDWTWNYNEKYGRRITDILQIGVMSMTT